jgi:hypothetical protein
MHYTMHKNITVFLFLKPVPYVLFLFFSFLYLAMHLSGQATRTSRGSPAARSLSTTTPLHRRPTQNRQRQQHSKSQASPLKPTRIVCFQLNHTRANARGGVRAAHVSRGTATRPSRSPKPPLPAAYLYPSSSLCPSPCPARAAT